MDLYLLYIIVKYIHILGAIAWIGGGVTLCALSLFAVRRNDEPQMLQVLQSVGLLANRWFVPASLITLVCGVTMAFLGNFWGDAWVVLGLVGFAATFVTGHFGLRPFAMKIQAQAEKGDMAGAVAAGKQMLQVAKFDYTMLFMVVADMVFKPQWNDLLLLGVIAAILVAGAVLFLGPLLGRTPAAPASA
jgi:uncharacterized membrane protein